MNSDFGKVPEECCLSGNQYSRIEIANTRKQVNRTYCKSEEDGGVNFIGCEIQAKGRVVNDTRWYNFERLPPNNFRERGLSESYRGADFFTTLERIRAAHWHILYCCIHCRNGYGCTHMRFYQRNVSIKTTKLISLPVSYAHSKIKINSNQKKTCFILGTVSKHCKWQLYFLVR